MYFYLLPKDNIGSLAQEVSEVCIKTAIYVAPKAYGVLKLVTTTTALALSVMSHCAMTGFASCVKWMAIENECVLATICAYLGTAILVDGNSSRI